MNCFDVFIRVLVAVIVLVVHLHHDHLVTTFELSHVLTNTLNNIYTSYLKLIFLTNFYFSHGTI